MKNTGDRHVGLIVRKDAEDTLPDSFVDLALLMADAAGRRVLEHFREPTEVSCKKDDSPVTAADRAVESHLREIVQSMRPEDGFLGEEFGAIDSRNDFTWIVDPIDGTKQFAGGRPTFVTLIALCRCGVPVLSVMDQPVLKERWVGVRGRRTLFNGKPVRTRECTSLANARLGMTSPRNLSRYDTLDPLHDATQFIAWGGHAYGFGQLASGWLDIVLEKHFGPFDTVPILPIVEGAGGIVTDWSGNPPNLTGKGKVLAAANRTLHSQMRDFLERHGESGTKSSRLFCAS